MKIQQKNRVNSSQFRLFLLMIGLSISFNLFSQITKTISSKEFNSITLDGASSFILIPSNKNKIEITMENEDVMNYIKIINKDKILKINTTAKNKDISKICSKLIFKIYFKTLKNISFEGAGKLTTKGSIKSQHITAKLKGAGNMDIKVNCFSFKGEMNGAGSLLVYGNCENSNLKLSGVGSIKAEKLIAKNTKAMVNGIGQIKVFTSKKLEADVNGIGSIYYAGNPKSKKFNKNGLGSIKPLEE